MLGINLLKTDREKARFFLMLNVALRSGLPLYKTLTIMKDSLPYYWKDIIVVLSESLRRGYSLYQTMGNFKDVFEGITIKLIEVGESTGKLDEICLYLFDFYETKGKVVNKLFSSISYPLFIIVFALIIAYIVLNFVFPVVTTMYNELGFKIPFITQVFKNILDLTSLKNILISLVLFLLIFGGIYVYLGKGKMNYFFLSIFSSLPIVSGIYKKYVVSKFLYSLVLCLKSGLTLSEAVKLSLQLLPQRIEQKYFSKVYKRILEGDKLSKVLKDIPIFSRVIINFIASYEETAKTEIIDKLVNYLNFEINMEIDRILIVIEPLLITGISIFVFFIAGAVLMPIIGISMQFVQ